MTEAVTFSNVIAIASLVSEVWMATDGNTHTHTHTLDLVYVNLFKVIKCLKEKI